MTITKSQNKKVLIPHPAEITAARMDAGLSKQDLSINSGVSTSTIANLEKGKELAYQMKTARRICKALGKGLWDLFGVATR